LRQPLLLSRTELHSCAVSLLPDRDAQCVYRLYDFINAQLIRPNAAYYVAGKVSRKTFSMAGAVAEGRKPG
jgi:hypothetical protein